MRILVFFTGGTIGAQSSSDIIGVTPGGAREILVRYAERNSGAVEFNTIEPLTILSENARPQDWDTVVRAIRATDLNGYNGIVVTHGTDTLAFAAAALSFALSDLAIPLVLVASNHPLHDDRSNGFANFCDAVDLIRIWPKSGVFVTYVNPDRRHLVHYGSRLMDATPMNHFFRSIGDSEFAEFRDGSLILLQDGGNQLTNDRITVLDNPVTGSYFAGKALLLKPYPGLDYTRFDLTGVDAVIHDLYHSGTACVVPKPSNLSLIAFARRCADENIPLFIAPWPDGSSLYESSRALRDRGVVAVPLMAANTAYVKTLYGLSLGLTGERLRLFLTQTNLSHEFAGAVQSSKLSSS